MIQLIQKPKTLNKLLKTLTVLSNSIDLFD